MKPGATIQIFGTRKCPDTRKAERWFKERGIPISRIDLNDRGLSVGELNAVAAHAGGMEALMDRASARYRDRGLLHAAPTGARIAQLLLEDPLLLRTPIVRAGKQAAIGFQPQVWSEWLAKE